MSSDHHPIVLTVLQHLEKTTPGKSQFQRLQKDLAEDIFENLEAPKRFVKPKEFRKSANHCHEERTYPNNTSKIKESWMNTILHPFKKL